MQIASIKKGVKIIGLVFLLVMALLSAIFLGQGVKSYLAKASTCPAQKISAEKVSANSAVISWETTEVTQGRVEYGTNATSLAFSAPEAASGKTHNVPLTLLTPNTVYYYLVTIGKTKCDSSGQVCDTTCVPWSFTTAAITPQKEIVAPLPTSTPRPATPSATLKPTGKAVSPTSTLDSFCLKVKLNIGKSSKDATSWALLKQYDIDGNGIINGLDVIKCQKTRK